MNIQKGIEASQLMHLWDLDSFIYAFDKMNQETNAYSHFRELFHQYKP